MKSELTNTATKLDLGETSSACPSKMGEGGNGSSHCPLPKVLVLSEGESLKLNMSRETGICSGKWWLQQAAVGA